MIHRKVSVEFGSDGFRSKTVQWGPLVLRNPELAPAAAVRLPGAAEKQRTAGVTF